MKTNRKILGLVLAIAISSSVFIGCSQTPTTVTPTTSTETSAPTTETSTTVTNNPTVVTPNVTPATQTASQSSSQVAKDSLASVLDDEASFSDSETLMNDSFSTKALDGSLGAKLDAKIDTALTTAIKETIKENAKTVKETVKDTAKAIKQTRQVKTLKAGVYVNELTKAGAVTKNSDGSVTIDTAKVKEFNKQKVEEIKAKVQVKAEIAKTKFEVLLPEVKAKLEVKAEVAKDKIQKLQRKNNIVRKSDVQTITNSDGTTTKLMTSSFENTKLGITRDIKTSKTFSADGKLIGMTHELTMKTSGFVKVSKRVVEINADGSKHVVTNSETTWTNGAKRVVQEDRTVDASGNVTGNGTITITDKAGNVKTYNLVTSGTSINVSTTATDAELGLEVKADGNTQTGNAVVTTTGETATVITEQVNVDAIASVDATVAVSVSDESTTSTSNDESTTVTPPIDKSTTVTPPVDESTTTVQATSTPEAIKTVEPTETPEVSKTVEPIETPKVSESASV